MKKRLAIVLICWLLSWFGVITPFAMFNEDFKHLAFNPKTFIMVAWSSTMIFAWVALFVMSIGWIRDHRVSRMWPIRGTIAGAISAISMFPQSIVVALPAIVLAVILVRFHTRDGAMPQ